MPSNGFDVEEFVSAMTLAMANGSLRGGSREILASAIQTAYDKGRWAGTIATLESNPHGAGTLTPDSLAKLNALTPADGVTEIDLTYTMTLPLLVERHMNGPKADGTTDSDRI